MKQKIYLLTLVLGFLGCNNQDTKKTNDENSVEINQTQSKDKLQNDPTVIESLTENKDTAKNKNFEDVLFTKKQIDFLVSVLKKDFKSNANSKVNVSIGETIEIWSDGEKGYVPGIDFDPKYSSQFYGDIDKDGNKEIFFTVNETAGGTAAWQIIFCLKEKKDGSLSLKRMEYGCPCTKQLRCESSPRPILTDVINNNLIVTIGCLKENDAECCPSLYYQVTYQYKDDSLIQINKKLMKE